MSQKITVLRMNLVHDNRFGSSAVRSRGGKICSAIFCFSFFERMSRTLYIVGGHRRRDADSRASTAQHVIVRYAFSCFLFRPIREKPRRAHLGSVVEVVARPLSLLVTCCSMQIQ